MGAVDNAAGIGILRYWCQKILPAVYDDSLSYYELLCKIVDKVNEVVNQVNQNGDSISDLDRRVEELNRVFEEFKAHGFDDYYRSQVEKWVVDNLDFIFNEVVRQVYFGLTLEGHFVAYIPEGWNEIVFDTGINYAKDDYGCLILRWDADSPFHVNQAREIVR